MALIFDNLTKPSESGCLEWTGRTEKRFGRGVYFADGKDTFAHRFAYERAHGPVPARMIVRQTCGNPLCCRLDHLALESSSEAATRQMAEGRKRKAPDFWSRLALRAKTGCWEWTEGTIRNGYGRLRHGGTIWLAHRLAYTLKHGAIPAGMYVCHTCDNPSCCNPEHLFLGTQYDNMADMTDKGRAPKRAGFLNPAAKLTPGKVRKIRRLRATGVSRSEIASKFGVTANAIALIEAGKTWANVPD
jgi:hypothetical protein